ncbi:phosphoribosylglycinamide formyltransferase [Auriscalpium vulgare]|uniref:Phosphoribosylglycinamide formyltransferase n=1 Tax=Auriscalpium vulgare TaxID=40419 RepID=A0ACB8RSP6_9AGAM|nr:phosphoribosylglycinamide formyltransferase [Auriscalpium vulgare]
MTDTPPPRRIVVLISGSGTNLQALIDAQDTPALPNAHIVLVLSNRKAAYGLTRAASARPPIPTAYLALAPYLKAHANATRADYDAAVAALVVGAQPDLVVLAGWMHVLSERFLDAVSPIAVINLHPALPGAFDGAHAIERTYAAFQRGEVRGGGAMVHRVVREVDRGEPLVVREVEIREGEAMEAFEERLHRTEWEIIVEGARKALDEVRPA